MIDFVAIDFETADSFHPCSLGLALVRNSKVVEVKHWLIKPSCYPYFHFYAQKIHGIHKEDVEFEPEFDELWHQIKPFIENQTLVAHNADFDIRVLRKTLGQYKLEEPKFRYFCSYRTARIVWKDSKKASLDFLCKQENIELEHHNADSDAYACALLFLRELELLGISDLTQLQKINRRVTKELKIAKEERAILRLLRRAERLNSK
ncbi:MAG TPA: DNA polymerase III subunit epsilon [Bacteroidales bacterium]|jgi:DNA polymerase-3 subunit epsilon|nr:DNA polymerase III subunit epsilon [Bacteroidales bacterium]